MTMYQVTATSQFGDIDFDIQSNSLETLANSVRETLANMCGCDDTAGKNLDWIAFDYVQVLDEAGNDVTAEANRLYTFS